MHELQALFIVGTSYKLAPAGGNFDIKDDILRVENDPDDESRLNLTINRKPIADWFREQWHRLRYGARVPQQEERKSRGFKL
ncbi:hypothetical protein HMPREF9075_00228 [Capnocytophaga sp. oral taxon 332 str. F0381]|nr:hypothetical protein HMPREF9075_00228 [Capnocytophaga sp. oral taxon 332 str. F0381]